MGTVQVRGRKSCGRLLRQAFRRPASRLDSSLFQYRSPIDLSNPKLRKLAAGLGPAYVRVSGTWRNATYFQNNDDPPLKSPPEGFNGVLTRAEWKGVVEFAKAVNAEIVASVATSAGTRDANGVWTAVQAKPWLDYTRQIGGHVAAMEFMNEPTLLSFGGVPKGYDAANFGRDAKIFGAFLRRESPGTIYLGPGSAAEGLPLPSMPGGRHLEIVSTDDLMKATGPIFDAFSYHFYSMPSHRCLGESGADPKQLLTPEWLDRDLTVYNFYAKERDAYLPGKNLWLTETGEGSCGGDTWAAEFADSFRLLDQFGGSRTEKRKEHHVQHTREQRLRPAQRGNSGTAPQLLGRSFVEAHDGNSVAGPRGCARKECPHLRAVHERFKRRCDSHGS